MEAELKALVDRVDRISSVAGTKIAILSGRLNYLQHLLNQKNIETVGEDQEAFVDKEFKRRKLSVSENVMSFDLVRVNITGKDLRNPDPSVLIRNEEYTLNGTLLPGLENAIIGMKPGEKKVATSAGPENHPMIYDIHLISAKRKL